VFHDEIEIEVETESWNRNLLKIR